jgi:alcohol dehydrogenase (cytochrome c)
MTEGGWNEPAPVVHDGVLYLNNMGNVIQALDAATGELIWENRVGPVVPSGDAMRGPRDLRRQDLHRDDGRAARRARRPHRADRVGDDHRRSNRGRVRRVERPDRHRRQSAARHGRLPVVPQREVLHRRLRCERRPPAMEVRDRRDVGRARAATRGATSRISTAPAATRGSRAATTPSSTRRTGESRKRSRGCRASRGNSALDRALYTSSTLALNPNDGSLRWYYQHSPGEALDLDEVYERVLVDVGGDKAVFTIGKPGILWKLDRETGRFLGHKETVFQKRLRPQSIRRPASRATAPT